MQRCIFGWTALCQGFWSTEAHKSMLLLSFCTCNISLRHRYYASSLWLSLPSYVFHAWGRRQSSLSCMLSISSRHWIHCSFKCCIWTSFEWHVLLLQHCSCPVCPTSCPVSQWEAYTRAGWGYSPSSGLWLSPGLGKSTTEHPPALFWGGCLSEGGC